MNKINKIHNNCIKILKIFLKEIHNQNKFKKIRKHKLKKILLFFYKLNLEITII